MGRIHRKNSKRRCICKTAKVGLEDKKKRVLRTKFGKKKNEKTFDFDEFTQEWFQAGIKEQERWLYENPKALRAVLQGIKESKIGKVKKLK